MTEDIAGTEAYVGRLVHPDRIPKNVPTGHTAVQVIRWEDGWSVELSVWFEDTDNPGQSKREALALARRIARRTREFDSL
jgi:hypothetical protein